MEIAQNITELIGSTPMVYWDEPFSSNSQIALKLENLNPAGSIKDRVALAMIENAISSKTLSDDGEIIEHEYLIGKCNKKISELFSSNEAVCNEQMLEEIRESDIVVLCPGSLYTSVGAVLCINKIKEAICDSMASIVYVCNIMTQSGETNNYTVSEHVEALEKIMNKNIDRVIVNNGKIDEDIIEKYKNENSEVVECIDAKDNYEMYDLVEIIDDKVRHNAELTKKIILHE